MKIPFPQVGGAFIVPLSSWLLACLSVLSVIVNLLVFLCPSVFLCNGLGITNTNVYILTVCAVESLPLTPSLHQHVKFLGWKMHRCACKQYIFWSYNTSTCNAMHFDGYLFTCQCKNEGLRISDFTLLLVGFKSHHVSEGIKDALADLPKTHSANIIYIHVFNHVSS